MLQKELEMKQSIPL